MKAAENAIVSEQASIQIEATPEAVYALVSDITRMGEWSPENVGGEWLRGGRGAVGDWFVGHNRTPERDWSRECEVAEADPARAFTFVVGGVEANCTWWSYELEPSDRGTKLTERWWLVNKTPAMQAATEEQFAARVELTRDMLRRTIEAVKQTAETV